MTSFILLLRCFLYTFFIFVCCEGFCAFLSLLNLFVKKKKKIKKFKTDLITSFILLLIVCLGVFQACSSVRVAMMWSQIDGKVAGLCLGAPSLLLSETKSEPHLWNAQVKKASSVNNRLTRTCLVMDMIRNNWLRIAYC